MSGFPAPPEPMCRVEVRFDPDPPRAQVRLEFIATAQRARHFAAAMTARGYQVVVDTNIRKGLRPLPCGELCRYD